MSSSYAVQKLLELNEKIQNMSPEEIRAIFGKDLDQFELYEENKDLTSLDIHSAEFLRQT